MQYTDTNCLGANQVGFHSTSSLQRNEANAKEALSVIDNFFEDHGLSHNIETLNHLTASLFPQDPECPTVWDMAFIQNAHLVAADISKLLSKLYELRSSELYKSAGI
jgi:hypothetical protein